MAKITLNTITGGYASKDALNANFQAIIDALDNTVSRDGSTPNTINTDIDMNGNDFNNIGSIDMTGGITIDGTDYIASMTTVYNNFLAITQSATISTLAPSGGSDGDVWYKV